MEHQEHSSHSGSGDPRFMGYSIIIAAIILSAAIVYSAQASMQLSARLAALPAAAPVVQATPLPTVQAPAATPLPTVVQQQPPSGTFDLSQVASKPTLGSASAPITMVTFEDFQCPFCARLFTDAEPQIIQDYVKTNKVKIVWMNFPLDQIHPNARPASNAAECVFHVAGNDAFWKFHDTDFTNNNVVNVGNVINDSVYAGWAKDAGVDMAKYTSCVSSKQYDGEISADESLGINYGVSGTPTAFLVNAKGKSTQIVGAQPYSAFKTAIDNLLAS